MTNVCGMHIELRMIQAELGDVTSSLEAGLHNIIAMKAQACNVN